MIGYLQGKILSFFENKIIVLTNSNVGYEVYIPLSYLSKNIAKDNDIELFVKTIVKDSEIELYGFLTEREKELFSRLINVTKLGPKSALTILSHMDPDKLINAILREDINSLSQIKGIGKKTAKRMILELKESITQKDVSINSINTTLNEEEKNSVYKESLSALINLGYKEEEVSPILLQTIEEDPDLLVEEVIRSALKKMAKLHG